MSSSVIRIENLTKKYKLYKRPLDRLKESLNPLNKKYHEEFYALENISFDVKRGETIGVIGKNGSGKSTLLKIITGVLSPSEGDVEIKGRISALLELGAGFNPEYTGLENIYLNGTMMGLSRAQMDEKMDEILTFAEIGDFIYQPVKTYSSGMFVRLAFAMAINVDPEILIIDEALAVGDSQFQLKCMNKIKEFKNKGKTIFFVSHDSYSVKNLCNMAIWLNDGRVEMIGESKVVVDEYERYMDKKNSTEQIVYENSGQDLEIEDTEFKVNSKVLNENKFEMGETLEIDVFYHVKKEYEDLVGGIAIYKSDGTYICGLNTKLDKYKLKSNVGKHKLTLKYDSINLLPGSYFIDVGFFEESGIGRLDYKRNYKEFRVISNEYRAEGIVLLDHKWEQEDLL